MSAEPTLPTKQREKIEEGSPYYNRLAANLALEFCPPINPCGDCGRPTIQGYECTFCREERIGVEFHISNLATGKKPAPSASHESWLAQKREEGWTYGPTKDAEKKTHPCFMPYDGLPVDQRLKDYIFAAIVEAFWTASQLGVAA